MIPRAHRLGLIAILLALPLAGRAAPPKAAKATNALPAENIQSTFVMPKAPAEGRDPFFPRATSVYQTGVIVRTAAPVDTGISLLKLKSILGSSLAQINNMTLAVGETEEVKTSAGLVSVRLVEIHAADESVVIEVHGQRRTLTFGDTNISRR